jgi:pterin-4a-carbinolamine dehydratase
MAKIGTVDCSGRMNATNDAPGYLGWENVFRTVTVRLSTFDIGHRPSERDQVCARMIERAYVKFPEGHPS